MGDTNHKKYLQQRIFCYCKWEPVQVFCISFYMIKYEGRSEKTTPNDWKCYLEDLSELSLFLRKLKVFWSASIWKGIKSKNSFQKKKYMKCCPVLNIRNVKINKLLMWFLWYEEMLIKFIDSSSLKYLGRKI